MEIENGDSCCTNTKLENQVNLISSQQLALTAVKMDLPNKSEVNCNSNISNNNTESNKTTFTDNKNQVVRENPFSIIEKKFENPNSNIFNSKFENSKLPTIIQPNIGLNTTEMVNAQTINELLNNNKNNSKSNNNCSTTTDETLDIKQFSSSNETKQHLNNSNLEFKISEFSSDTNENIIIETLSDIITQVTSSENCSDFTNFSNKILPMDVDGIDNGGKQISLPKYRTPILIAKSTRFPSQHFTKGCKWAPDGQCLVANTAEDNKIRFYNTPYSIYRQEYSGESVDMLEECLNIKEAEIIYDYCWYPLLDSQDPATCCLATTSKDQPVHLWDAFDGSLRASYIAYNNVHEVHSANSICFSPNGQQILCGFKKELFLFFTDRPGSEYEKWSTTKKQRRLNQNGIISCIDYAPDGNLFACGCYDKTVAIYSAKNGQAMEFLTGHTGGVTSLKFSLDGNRLYTGARKDSVINCWDMRYLSSPVICMKRKVDTNQRIYFDQFYRKKSTQETVLASGSTDGFVSLWNLETLHDNVDNTETVDLNPMIKFKAHEDCVNGCSVNPFFPIIATSSGQRKFYDTYPNDSETENDFDYYITEENILKLWYIPTFHTQHQTKSIH